MIVKEPKANPIRKEAQVSITIQVETWHLLGSTVLVYYPILTIKPLVQ